MWSGSSGGAGGGINSGSTPRAANLARRRERAFEALRQEGRALCEQAQACR